MIYFAFICFICTCYAFIMESCHAFVYDSTLADVGIEFAPDEQDVAAVQQDPSFI